MDRRAFAPFLAALFLAPASLRADAEMDGSARADADEAIVARAGDIVLSLEALKRAIAARPPELASGQTVEALEALVRRLLDEEILAAEARRRSMDQAFAHRQRRDRHVVQTFLRERIDDPLLDRPITDEEIQAYYEERRGEFERPEQRRAAHILVGNKERARELIELIPELSNAELRDLIRRESRDDRTRLSAGDLRFFDREGNALRERDVALHPAIAEAAFQLERVGEVYRDPIPVDGNFSVLILRGIRPERRPGWEAARTRIEAAIHAARREAAVRQLAKELYDELTTSMDEPLLGKIRFAD